MTSAFVAEDNELDKILRALSDISKTFKSGTVDPLAVDATLKRAALWAVQKSLLDREVRSLAITDDLTGFFNRRGFLASVTQQLKLAHRDNQSILLFYFDVDNLKGINDSFGHREGDIARPMPWRKPSAIRTFSRDSVETSLPSWRGKHPFPTRRLSCLEWRSTWKK